jgi:predicted lysophospholipase L1 biosynthesis ABC-type transport system permease subunit
MLGDGDEASRRSLGSSGPRFREATAEERAVYRKWRRGMIVFYCALTLISGVIAAASYSSAGLTRLTSLSVRQTTTSARAH